jgi:hypothetical protein
MKKIFREATPLAIGVFIGLTLFYMIVLLVDEIQQLNYQP